MREEYKGLCAYKIKIVYITKVCGKVCSISFNVNESVML